MIIYLIPHLSVLLFCICGKFLDGYGGRDLLRKLGGKDAFFQKGVLPPRNVTCSIPLSGRDNPLRNFFRQSLKKTATFLVSPSSLWYNIKDKLAKKQG